MAEGKTVAQLVDDSIQELIVEFADGMVALGIDWGNTLSAEEYREFVKRNLKGIRSRIGIALEDRL